MGTFRIEEETFSIEPSTGPWKPPDTRGMPREEGGPGGRVKRDSSFMDEVMEELYVMERVGVAESSRDVNYDDDTGAYMM